jgi:glutamine amidotransferase-like uncharacterized protein
MKTSAISRSFFHAGAFALFLCFACAHFAAGKPIQVAVYEGMGCSGKGIPCVSDQLGTSPDFMVTKITAEQIRTGALKKFDVVMFTGGAAMTQSKALGTEGRDAVKKFVEHGGGYMGICAGAFLACDGYDWAIPVLDAKTVSPKWQRGEGTVKIELTELGQKVLGQTNKLFDIHYENGPIIKQAKSGSMPDFKPLAYFRTELAENGTPVGVMINAPAIVVSTCGKGRVVVTSPHPEQSKGLEGFVPAAVRWLAKR